MGKLMRIMIINSYDFSVDFLDLFPGRNLRDGPLSVVTLSQKTEHDMSAWSEDMELEREELLQYVSNTRTNTLYSTTYTVLLVA